MTAPIGQQVDTTQGRTSTNPFITIIETRAPTGNDGINNGLQVGQRWIDKSDDNQEYFLLGFIASNGYVQANWVALGGSASVTDITATSPLTANGVSGTPENGPVTLSFSDAVHDGVLITDNSGTASFLPNSGTAGFVLTANSVAPPSWQANASGYSAASITVSPIAGQGNFTTITAALSAAVSGQDILIKAGTYTENLTLKAGVNLVAWEANAQTPLVTLVGNCTYSGSGIVSISGIRLQTNGSFCLTVSGTNPSFIRLTDCFINCVNNTGISYTSSNSSSAVELYACHGNLATTGIAFFASSGAGYISFEYCSMSNSGGSVTPSESSTLAYILFSTLYSPLSSSGDIRVRSCAIDVGTLNTPALTISGPPNGNCSHSILVSGTAPAIIVNSGGTFDCRLCSLASSNTNAVDGLGTFLYADLVFRGASSKINTSIQTVFPSSPLLVHSSAGTPALSVNTSGVTTIANSYALPVTAGTSGYVLTTNGTNAAAWAINSSGFSAASITVSPTLGEGNFTTIAAALAAAVSGQTILIKEGVYTENLSLKAGVNLSALPGQGSQGNVTIIGKCSFSGPGTVTIAQIRLQTNSDYFLEVSGSGVANVFVEGCYLNCTNNTGINFSNSNAASTIQIHSPQGDLLTTGIAFWNSSSPGVFNIFNADFYNTGLSVTPSDVSDGELYINNCDMISPISSSGTGAIKIIFCNLTGDGTLNTTMLAHNGTGLSTIHFNRFLSGTAPALTVGSGCTLNVFNCHLVSSNTNIISGAGALNEAANTFILSTGISVGTHSIEKSSALKVYDNYLLPSIDGTVGQVLKTDGAGTLTWQNP